VVCLNNLDRQRHNFHDQRLRSLRLEERDLEAMTCYILALRLGKVVHPIQKYLVTTPLKSLKSCLTPALTYRGPHNLAAGQLPMGASGGAPIGRVRFRRGCIFVLGGSWSMTILPVVNAR